MPNSCNALQSCPQSSVQWQRHGLVLDPRAGQESERSQTEQLIDRIFCRVKLKSSACRAGSRPLLGRTICALPHRTLTPFGRRPAQDGMPESFIKTMQFHVQAVRGSHPCTAHSQVVASGYNFGKSQHVPSAMQLARAVTGACAPW